MSITTQTIEITDRTIRNMYARQLPPSEMHTDDMSYRIARTILYQLQYGRTSDDKHGGVAMMCWGVNHIEPLKSGVSFKVQGAKIKGHVEIEYQQGHDHYDIRIYDKSKKMKYDHQAAYCDDLVSLIDNAVERCTK